jgi:TFIIF-interacting CTD phosphatase-like protein
MNNYLKRLSIKNKTNLNNNNKNINIKESPIDSFSKFSNIINNKNNSKNDISEYSNENSNDINYIFSPYLKDKILSPGDDDICFPKQSSPPKDNPQGYDDDICLYNIYNIKNISMHPNNNNGKKILILDLDETLVHSSFLPFRKDINSNEIIDPDIHLKIYFDKKYYNVYVLTRPYIYEFLNDMSKIFIIYIFTASVKEYANPLLNEIDKNNII